ncbi:MAG: hypothetical protein O3B65_06660 [Chloroflexi bacterium]|nr:hypothetical protein [Chloroflexota bacterium]
MKRMISKRISTLVVVLGVLAISAVPTFASHTPAPEFEHPGKAEQCDMTNPANNPAFGDLPQAVQGSLWAIWISDCA